MTKRVLIVYDFKTPNGYLPFTYTKETLDDVMDFHIKNEVKLPEFENAEMISIYELDKKLDNNFLYMVLIDASLQKEDVKNIISPLLLSYCNDFVNFQISYFDYGIKQMYSLI